VLLCRSRTRARLGGLASLALKIRRRCQRRRVSGVTGRCWRSGGQQSDERGEQGTISPVQSGLTVGSARHGNVVAQDEQLDILRCRGPAEQPQPAENPDEDQVKQTQRHDARSSWSHRSPRSPRSRLRPTSGTRHLPLPELRRPSHRETPKITKLVCQRSTPRATPSSDRTIDYIIDLETIVTSAQVRSPRACYFFRSKRFYSQVCPTLAVALSGKEYVKC
jgi:hypothetical protein